MISTIHKKSTFNKVETHIHDINIIYHGLQDTTLHKITIHHDIYLIYLYIYHGLQGGSGEPQRQGLCM